MPENTRIGFLTDPDLPQQVADHLADRLNSEDEHGRTAHVEVDPVTAGRANSTEILDAANRRREQAGWDYAICVTDLPLRANGVPVLADISTNQRSAVVSLPTLGGTQPRRRSRQVIAQVLDELTNQESPDSGPGGRHGLRSWLTELVGPIRRSTPGDGIDARYATTRTRGRLRLLSGMVRTNQPWRLIFGLSSALAAAIATSAFGLSSSTVWQIGDSLAPWRKSAFAIVAVAVLVLWLIAGHGLWERSTDSALDRDQAWLYNASTILTLSIGVGLLYVGLFVINLAIAAFLVSEEVLVSTLGHAAGMTTYVNLAWGFTTMGIIGGALGSSLESDAAVRRAAYGYREQQRRRQSEPG